jgi:xanthine dehydrogenase YagT iron-sulfur-binding subunit
LQAAFVERDALQCGYCTPGQICSAAAMLGEAAAGWPSAASASLTGRPVTLDAAEIRERMSGNLCRCGAYVNILAAIQDVYREAP